MINKLSEKVLEKLLEKSLQFKKQEDGLALTEYLILLGVITGAVVLVVTLFGDQVGGAWNTAVGSIFANCTATGTPPVSTCS
jgi:pilus assembly protein Flp/PilA